MVLDGHCSLYLVLEVEVEVEVEVERRLLRQREQLIGKW
jgi:hypothetical protein